MSNIGFIEKTFYVLSYSDFEDLVNKHYLSHLENPDYSFSCEEELGNDVDKAYMDVKKEGFSNWDMKDLEKRETNYRGRLILKFLVHNHILPEGNYLIRVSW